MAVDQNAGIPLTATQKLNLALGGLMIAIVLGSTGFILLEGMDPLDALYMTIITLSTVGFGEVKTLHPEGRVFVIFLILFGVALAGFTATVIGQIVLEGQFKEILGRRKMENKIRKFSNHFIIAGFGRVGRQVAMEFQRKKVNFVVIEKDEEAVSLLHRDGFLFIQGEATDDDTLRRAGIELARTLISTLPDEAHNVYLTLTARDMNRNLQIIARADYEEGVKKLMRAGANHVVTPHVLGGIRMAMASLRPNVLDFMSATSLGESDLTIEEMVVPGGCELAGKSLVESNLKKEFGITIIGVKKEDREMVIAPGPETVLEENDILVLIGKMQGLEDLSKKLTT
ncbi:MAG: potassium channel protein [Candidatus Zixiibacteriota bacterium]|nr:MAG: potassium channel protein [candidate division Zixibacteria bacterium]